MAGVSTSESHMPTKKPRVHVTLEPEAYEVLVGMAKLGNTNPGRVLAEIAAPVLPALKRLVEAAAEFSAWEKSLKGELTEVHKEVAADIDAVIKALEARKTPFAGAGGSPVPVIPSGASVTPASPAGEAGPGCVSIPRSAKPGPVSEASAGPTQPPYSNTGVRIPNHKRNQGVSKTGKRGQKSAV